MMKIVAKRRLNASKDIELNYNYNDNIFDPQTSKNAKLENDNIYVF